MIINKAKKNIYIIHGDDESIKSFFKAVELLGKIKDIKIQKLECSECNIISKLENEQKMILSSAKKYGYYDYPRKITSEELSKKLGINKDITIQALRKAEKSIFSEILDET